MPRSPPSNPRKRQHSEQCPFELSGAAQLASKKQKLSHPSASQPPAAFWENLSKIWLTKRALRELNRRRTQFAPSPPSASCRRLPRPVTRRVRTELQQDRQPTQSAADFLHNCAARCFKDIQVLSRHGGPDLSDLRGVCIIRYLLVPELIISSSVS